MKLTVLVDNHSLIDKYYLAEPALSFYIEDEDKKTRNLVKLNMYHEYARSYILIYKKKAVFSDKILPKEGVFSEKKFELGI